MNSPFGAVAVAIRARRHAALGPVDGVTPPVKGTRSEAAEGRATAARRFGAKRCRPDGIAGRSQGNRGFIAGQQVITVGERLFHRSSPSMPSDEGRERLGAVGVADLACQQQCRAVTFGIRRRNL